MAIDFCVDYPCPAKRALGSTGLLELCQARTAYNATQNSPDRRRETDRWTRVVRGPGRDHIETVTVGELRRKSNRLVEFTADCEGCPANVTGGPAGCLGRITYPIDAPSERLLAAGAAAIAAAPREHPGRTVVEWIGEGPVDGARVRRMRSALKAGVRFFELDEPLPVATPRSETEDRQAITTDQLIQMLFFAFPERTGAFHFVAPRVAMGSYRAFFQFVLDELDLGHRRETLASSTTLEQLRLYARAVSIADDLGVDVLLD